MKLNIGALLDNADSAIASLNEYLDAENNNVAAYLANWKKSHRLQERNKKKGISIDGNTTLSTSLRPTRQARSVALVNIKKQADAEFPFLKPQAKVPKKKLKEVEELKTDEPSTSEPKIKKSLRVVQEKPLKKNARTKSTKKSAEDTEELSEKMDTNVPTDPKADDTPLEEMPVTSFEKLSIGTKIKKKSKKGKKKSSVIPSDSETFVVSALDIILEETPTPRVEKLSDGTKKNLKKESPNKTFVVEVIAEEIETLAAGPVVETSGVVIDESPPISPVPFPDVVSTAKDESNDELLNSVTLSKNIPNVFIDEPKKTKKAFENLNQSMKSLDVSRKGSKLKRTKYKRSEMDSSYDVFSPKSASSILQADVEKTSTPNNARSPFDPYAACVETVLRLKNKDLNEPVVEVIQTHAPEDPGKEAQFQAPAVVASKKRKPPVVYDALGNVRDGEAAKRTKVIAVPSFDVLPDSMDGRPVRTRTKVRRLGVDGDGDVAETKKGTEDLAIKVAANITKKSTSTIMHKTVKLPSSAQKYKTPLSTITNQWHSEQLLNPVPSTSKDYPSSQKKPRLLESRVIIKPSETDMQEVRKLELKNKMEKEEKAALKKIEALNEKREKLKLKNTEKLARAKECRAKIETQKHDMIVQSEKEKEVKRQLLLREREDKIKAEINKKKILADKKLAELEERRRAEEEARLAKIRENEMEQKRQERERQKQIELEEKRARERLEEKRKMMEADQLMRQKMAQELKAQQALTSQKKQYEGLYLPRNENDYGLEDEMSEESGDEDPEPSKRPVPSWVQEAKKGNPIMKYLTSKQLALFIPMQSRTPTVEELFGVAPGRMRPRKSSAVWDITISSPM